MESLFFSFDRAGRAKQDPNKKLRLGVLVADFDLRKAGGVHQVRYKFRLAVIKHRIELFLDAAVAGRDPFNDRLEVTKVVKLGVEQVRTGHVRQRG